MLLSITSSERQLTNIVADVGGHKTDEHGGHGLVAKAACQSAAALAAAEAGGVALGEEDGHQDTAHDTGAHHERDGGEGGGGHLRSVEAT